MSNEMDDLKRAFDLVTPTPDAALRRQHLKAAAEKFAQHQGSADQGRPMSEAGRKARWLTGARTMINTISTRGWMTGVTALAGLGILVVMPWDAVMAPPDLVDGPDPSRDLSSGTPERPELPEVGPLVDVSPPVVRREEALVPAPAPAPTATPKTVPKVRRAVPAPSQEGATVSSDAFQGDQQARTMVPGARMLTVPDTADARPAPPSILRPPVVSEEDGETFANGETSSVKVTRDAPVSTFSIDVDTASYAFVRRALEGGQLPSADAVRVEELVNYFPYSYPAPGDDVPFSTRVTVLPTPWNAGTELVHIGLQGALPAIDDRPPLNLVFLIDTSGSMQSPDKLPLLKASLRMLLDALRPEDEIAIVTYAGSAGEVLAPTPASSRSTILAALDQLEAGGSTAGAAGIEAAYRRAEAMATESEIGRVILATDGDFNVGVSDPEALKDLIFEHRDSGIYLSVLGFGRGNLDDATMQALAQNGNGQAAYIDTLSEARKVLVDQLTGALFPIANDVKVQVEFNPAEIAEYRLIGYETRSLRRQDFANDAVDAGDIGAGHSVTAIYEVTPVGSDAILNGPLRYAEPGDVTNTGNSELGFLKLRYKTPGADQSQVIETPILRGDAPTSEDVRFSVAIAGFGQLLRGGEYLKTWSWDAAIALASDARGNDPFGYRAETIDLMRIAEALSR